MPNTTSKTESVQHPNQLQMLITLEKIAEDYAKRITNFIAEINEVTKTENNPHLTEEQAAAVAVLALQIAAEHLDEEVDEIQRLAIIRGTK